MARSETSFRIPLRLRIVMVSVCVHGILGIVLLSMGPMVAGKRPLGPLPSARYVFTEEIVPPPIRDPLDDEPEPTFETDPIRDPEPDDLAREDIPVEETSDPIVVRLGTLTPGGGQVRLRPLRLRREGGRAVEKTTAKVVTRNAVRFSLADLPDGGAIALEIRVELNASGAVTDVVVRRPSGVVSFDEAVLASVSRWR